MTYAKRTGTTDNGGVSAVAAGYAGGAELTEQREQSQTTFELCRVATEVGESQGRHDDDEAGRLFKAMDFLDFSPRKGFKCAEYFTN